MKITHISYERLDLKLSEPYQIAYEKVTRTTNFILKVETDTAIVGYGCAAPDYHVTRETILEVESQLKTVVLPYLKGKNPYMLSEILDSISELLQRKASVLAMVDMALLDIMAKKMGVPLFNFLGGHRTSMPTSITLAIEPISETIKKATEHVRKGFFILKIKGGLSLVEDIEKMVLLRQKFPKVKLRFDGNQGYSIEDAIGFYLATSDLDIEILEQPTKVGMDERLGIIRNKVNVPIMADESLKTLKDAFRLAKNERIDMVNIKLMKVGGIKEATRISAVAKAANLDAMVGCLDECRLGIAAGLHFALSNGNVKYADLDGHLDIEGDPFKDLFVLEKGILYPTDKAGLGNIGYI